MPFAYAIAGLLLMLAAEQSRIVGAIPPSIGAAVRIVWMSIDSDGGEVRCQIVPPSTWACGDVLPTSQGVVVVVGSDGVTATSVGAAAIEPTAKLWGRLVRVTPGGVAPEDLHDLQLRARRPERSRVRQQATRLTEMDDDTVDVEKLSETTFWVSGGGSSEPNAFVELEGPAVGNQRIDIRQLSDAPPDELLFWPAVAGATIAGRVHGPRDEDADRVAVELWELLPLGGTPSRLDDTTPALRRRSVLTARDGTFSFDRIAGPPILLAASHSTLGTVRRWITELGPFIDLELTPPTRAVGRVLKRGLPVASALIRFVPDLDAFTASADPRDYVAPETRTGDDGRFSLPLPRRHAGTIQILVDDSTSARVAVQDAPTKGELPLGDISVPDGRHLTVRLLGATGCTLATVGPLGVLGLTIVRAASVTDVYELELPEAGTWSLIAECGRATYGIDPPIVVVPADRASSVFDARVVKTPG